MGGRKIEYMYIYEYMYTYMKGISHDVLIKPKRIIDSRRFQTYVILRCEITCRGNDRVYRNVSEIF